MDGAPDTPTNAPTRRFATLTPFVAGPHAGDPITGLRLALSEQNLGPSPAATVAAVAELAAHTSIRGQAPQVRRTTTALKAEAM